MQAMLLFVAAALIAGAPAARAAAAVKVTSVEQKGHKLFIHATANPEFTAFKLSGPPRVVIDLNGGDVSAAAQRVEAHQGGIAGWSGAQFDEGKTRVGRIVVALETDERYDVLGQRDRRGAHHRRGDARPGSRGNRRRGRPQPGPLARGRGRGQGPGRQARARQRGGERRRRGGARERRRRDRQVRIGRAEKPRSPWPSTCTASPAGSARAKAPRW